MYAFELSVLAVGPVCAKTVEVSRIGCFALLLILFGVPGTAFVNVRTSLFCSRAVAEGPEHRGPFGQVADMSPQTSM